ncbi:MAG: hypothetical protein Q9166_003697 [cf. Caloplaca sp. 2 TL-2023]
MPKEADPQQDPRRNVNDEHSYHPREGSQSHPASSARIPSRFHHGLGRWNLGPEQNAEVYDYYQMIDREVDKISRPRNKPDSLHQILEADARTRLTAPGSVTQWYPKKYLGSGGFGNVYLWEKQSVSNHSTRSVRLAVKDCRPVPFWRDYPVEPILIRKLNRLGCRNIITVYDWIYKPNAYQGDIIRICEEFAEHRHLEHVRYFYKKNKLLLPEAFVWHVFWSAANALCYCRHGTAESSKTIPGWDPIVHLDVKPANLLLTDPDGSINGLYPTIKLADFGLAYTVPEKGHEKLRAWKSTFISGTEDFKAPEVKDLRPSGEGSFNPVPESQLHGSHTDIYSLGLTMSKIIDSSVKALARHPDAVDDRYIDRYYSSELLRLVKACHHYPTSIRPKIHDLYQRTLEGMTKYQRIARKEQSDADDGQPFHSQVLYTEVQQFRFEHDPIFKMMYETVNRAPLVTGKVTADPAEDSSDEKNLIGSDYFNPDDCDTTDSADDDYKPPQLKPAAPDKRLPTSTPARSKPALKISADLASNVDLGGLAKKALDVLRTQTRPLRRKRNSQSEKYSTSVSSGISKIRSQVRAKSPIRPTKPTATPSRPGKRHLQMLNHLNEPHPPYDPRFDDPLPTAFSVPTHQPPLIIPNYNRTTQASDTTRPVPPSQTSPPLIIPHSNKPAQQPNTAHPLSPPSNPKEPLPQHIEIACPVPKTTLPPPPQTIPPNTPPPAVSRPTSRPARTSRIVIIPPPPSTAIPIPAAPKRGRGRPAKATAAAGNDAVTKRGKRKAAKVAETIPTLRHSRVIIIPPPPSAAVPAATNLKRRRGRPAKAAAEATPARDPGKPATARGQEVEQPTIVPMIRPYTASIRVPPFLPSRPPPPSSSPNQSPTPTQQATPTPSHHPTSTSPTPEG